MAFGFGFGMPRSFAVARFSPLSLFASGAPGVWYDPSDYSTLFQDSAGTTPVTAVEQPVGLMLDKSQGLVLGSELVTNGDFSNGTTGWTGNNATLSSVSGGLQITVTGQFPSANQSITVTTGRTYKISFSVVSATTGFAFDSLTLRIGSASSPAVRSDAVPSTMTAYVAAAATGVVTLQIIGTSLGALGDVWRIDNISVKELPGNHAFQATSASRPVLSARYNLLTDTATLSGAIWSSFVSGSAITNTAGTLNFPNSISGSAYALWRAQTSAAAGAYTSQVEIKAGTTNKVNLILSDGTGATIATTVCNLTADYQIFTVSGTCAASARLEIGANGFTGSTMSAGTVLVRNADLRPANQGVGLPAYQRVNTSTDYNTTGFLPYLKFDGVDDSLSTNSISFTSTNKVSLFTGIRKLSNAGQFIAELSAGINLNNGAFSLEIFNDTKIYAASKGTAGPAEAASGVLATTLTTVVTEQADISAPLVLMRLNGAQVAQSTSTQGTGNYGNYPLFIGRRNNSLFPFNGQLYGLIIVGKAVTAGELSSTETYVNQKTGAY